MPKKKQSFFFKFLNAIEVMGNKLPNPVTIFFSLTIILILISSILAYFGTSVEFKSFSSSGEEITKSAKAVNLLSASSLIYFLTNFISNFVGFAPLGVVLIAMIGVGVAEGTGLIQTALKKSVLSAPKGIITFTVVFVSLLSSIASDVGYVILIPLGATIFLSVGRHPLAGIAAAFAGVSGGFSANLIFGPVDAILGGLTTEATELINPITVGATANWYFMIASTFLIAFLGTWITDYIVEPKLGKYDIKEASKDIQNEENSFEVTPLEMKGLWAAIITGFAYIGLILAIALPINSPLRNPINHSLTDMASPMIQGIIVLMSLGFLLPGLVYGLITKSIKSDNDLVKMFEKSMREMAGYLVLTLFAAQFIALFNYSQIGTIIAVKGADILRDSNMTGMSTIIIFILISAGINLLMGSAAAKWAILAPIFVPMFMQLGYDPAFTQIAYRIGDSATNVINPVLPYLAIIITLVQRYDKKAGIGTIISMMIPYSILFLIFWTLLLVVWYYLNLPLGPGVYSLLPTKM